MDVSATRARTDEAKEQRRTAILGSALQEFYDNGLSGARLDDIANRANVSKGTLYLYFDSKEALFRELIHYHTASAIQQLRSDVETATSIKQALESFAALAPMVIEHSEMPRLMKVMIGESQAFPDIINHHREHIIDKTNAMFTQVLSHANARGEIEIDDPALVARLVITPLVYSGIWHAVFAPGSPNNLDYTALLQTHVKLLLKGMTYRPQETEPA